MSKDKRNLPAIRNGVQKPETYEITVNGITVNTMEADAAVLSAIFNMPFDKAQSIAHEAAEHGQAIVIESTSEVVETVFALATQRAERLLEHAPDIEVPGISARFMSNYL